MMEGLKRTGMCRYFRFLPEGERIWWDIGECELDGKEACWIFGKPDGCPNFRFSPSKTLRFLSLSCFFILKERIGGGDGVG